MPLPHVLLSAAVSLDGYLDDTGPERLLLSGPADFERVDEVRASVDAILVGAGTIRADNPRLLVNSAERRAARRAAGQAEYPLKVTVTNQTGTAAAYRPAGALECSRQGGASWPGASASGPARTACDQDKRSAADTK